MSEPKLNPVSASDKPWWASKTLWVNAIAVAGAISTGLFGLDIDQETQASLVAGVLAVVNILLRVVTDKPVYLKKKKKETENADSGSGTD
jgi:hypothetical protein